MSLAKFDLGVTASGNGGFDLLCDESARAIGDLAGIGTIKCPSALPGMAPDKDEDEEEEEEEYIFVSEV